MNDWHKFNNPVKGEQQNLNYYRELYKQQWISVKDRLPKEGMPVLAYNTDGDRFLAEMLRFYDKPDVYEKWFFVPDNCGCCNIFNTSVTHWMPLPEPPESYAAAPPAGE